MDAGPQVERRRVVGIEPGGGVEIGQGAVVVAELAADQAALQVGLRVVRDRGPARQIAIGTGRGRVAEVVGDAAAIEADRVVVGPDLQGRVEIV